MFHVLAKKNLPTENIFCCKDNFSFTPRWLVFGASEAVKNW